MTRADGTDHAGIHALVVGAGRVHGQRVLDLRHAQIGALAELRATTAGQQRASASAVAVSAGRTMMGTFSIFFGICSNFTIWRMTRM